MKKLLTLCIAKDFSNDERKVLLGMKKRGFGAGRWNGFGGKVQSDESIEDAARREMLEESGVTISDMEKCGILEFSFEDDPDILETHLFRVEEFQGFPIETEEMTPKWFDASEIPFNDMWADDRFWFPLFLAGKKFTGRFHFDSDHKILEHELKEVDVI